MTSPDQIKLEKNYTEYKKKRSIQLH